ncbi:MAG: retron St85 family effector protein [Candidatus Hodarchaeota archaeon]
MLEEISKCINEDIFPKLRTRGLTVFLVGGGQESLTSVREPIRKELINRPYHNWLDVYYPEELFEELILSRAHFDLLSLENLLAKSVHAVVIILESPGAIAELGAFANHKGLRDKLIVVVDKKYRKAKSFIVLGPVRYLKENTKSLVLFHNLRKPQIKRLGSEIRHSVRKISEGIRVDTSVTNPIVAQHFLLAAIYVMEPVQREILNNMIQVLRVRPYKKVITIVISSLNILLHQRQVLLKDGKYQLTTEGLARLRLTVELEPEGRNIQHSLDKLRVKILDHTLRGKNYGKVRRGSSDLRPASARMVVRHPG